ncbi:MAG TPA: hypothetical protein VME43_12060 [Bryobacteraceae bacterium]|nr:hypothetical protein [Bryobacteraceae bacterium]
MPARANPSSSNPPSTPARQLAGFLARFDPPVSKTMRAARAALQKQFPAAYQLVYDNYNFLVVGFCTTERPSDCFVSLAANAKGVDLMFYYGATLPDPQGLLHGSGNQNRFLRLETESTLAQPDVQSLIQSAVRQSKSPLASTGRGRLIIRAISAKQRPRRQPRP